MTDLRGAYYLVRISDCGEWKIALRDSLRILRVLGYALPHQRLSTLHERRVQRPVGRLRSRLAR